jgi:hypothetical protein
VVADNDDKRHQLLVAALEEDATFSYAVADLAALEKRLQKYQATADAALAKQILETKEQLERETDPQKANALAMSLLTELMRARRYHALVGVARAILAHPPPRVPSPVPGSIDAEEMAAYYTLTAHLFLKDSDALLRDGEAFMRSHPSSPFFAGVKSIVETAIQNKRRVEEGKQKAIDDVAKISAENRWDLCQVARVYSSNHQEAEARRLWRACLEVGKSSAPRKYVIRDLVNADVALADWAQARKDLVALEKEDAETYRSSKTMFELQIPAD